MTRLRRRTLLVFCGLVVALGATASGAAPQASPSAQTQYRHTPDRPTGAPGDDRRMSSMGRLARLGATGRLERAIARWRAARRRDTRDAVTVDDFDSGDGPAGGQAETSIAVDASGQHIVVGINDTRGFGLSPLSVSGFIYSDDGGATFVDGGSLPITVPVTSIAGTAYPQVYGDPEVKYAGGSTFLYFSIVVAGLGGSGTAQTMGVHRSTDFGHTWQGPFVIGPATNPHGLVSGGSAVDAADKEFADYDPATGRVIFTWTNFTSTLFAPSGAEISSTFSDDVATATPPTWASRTIVANGSADGQASIPRFAGSGSPNVYVAWRRFPGGSNQNVGFARSTNRGATFSSPINLTASFFTMDQVLGNDRNNTSPSLAVDTSTSPFQGRIYVAYSNNNNHDGADAVVQISTNQGTTFGSPILLDSRPGADRAQWFPWVTVDRNTGRVYVFYYDQGIAADGDLTETSYQFSDDGGTTWSRPAPLTERPFHAAYGNDTGEPNLGDYNQAVAQGGELFAVWAGNPPVVRFDDGQPTSSSLTAPDMAFARVPESSSRLSLDLGTVSFGDAGPSALAGNGAVDPGEQISLTLPLRNYVTNALAATAVTGVTATLTTTTPGVVVLQGSSPYPSLAPGATGTNAASFIISTGPSFAPGTPIELALAVTSAQGSTTLPFRQSTGTPFATTLVSENFDASSSLPVGWSSVHGAGSTPAWTTATTSLGASPGAISRAAYHSNTTSLGWERLYSPQFLVPADADYVTVDFDAAYDTEDDPTFNVQAFDGLLLRVADLTPGRALRSVAVEAFAEEFTTGAAHFYPKHLPRSADPNYFPDLSAWAGDSAGYRHVHLKLPGMAGSTAQLRFEYTQDNLGTCANVRAGHRCGVLIDNVVVSSVRAVTPTATTLTASANPSLAGQPVVFTATVTASDGSFATPGAVTFREGAAVLAGPTPIAGGQASFSTAALGLGSHTITASYTGGGGLVGDSSGSALQHVVVGAAIDDVSQAEGSSGVLPMTFTVSLSQPSPETVTVSYATADGAATVAGNDYVAASGVVTFAPGETSQPVVVSIVGDTTPESDETFFVNLTGATNAILTDGQGLGTILDDDGSVVNEASVRAMVASGGARLRSLQNPDGGWYFGAGDTACGGGPAGVSCTNTLGVTGLGLLATYARTSDPSALAGAVAAGDALVTQYGIAAAQAPPLMPFSQDIEFLVGLAGLTGNTTYATTAQAWFQIAIDRFPNAADRIDAFVTNRDGQGLRTLAAWDAASFIRAAKAVGAADYALAAATRIRDREADWKDTDPSHRFDQCANPSGCGPADNPLAFDYTILGEGSLLWAIHDLPGFDVQIGEYRSFLLARQDPAGSWDVGDSQITSYVVLGLAAVGGTGTDAAMQSAAAFFLANALPSGGWPSYVTPPSTGGEFAEVDAEIVRAAATLFSTPSGANVSVVPAQLATVTFSSVSASGLTTVVAVDESTVAAVSGGFEVVGGLTYEVSTTAAHAGAITVCFSVPWISDPVAFANVRILHAEAGVLVDRTILPPDSPAPDFATRRVCSLVSSLSPFAIATRGADTTPPSLAVALTPPVVWPPNDRMVTIRADLQVSDDADPAPAVQLLSITSSDRDASRGHDHGEPDVAGARFGTDDRTFQVRAETDGRRDRVYTVVYRATDRSGNTRDVTATVLVRHAWRHARR